VNYRAQCTIDIAFGFDDARFDATSEPPMVISSRPALLRNDPIRERRLATWDAPASPASRERT
jgi:hypothetical protein